MVHYRTEKFPKTRLATFDICAVGKSKHQIVALLEMDVTDSRKKIRQARSRETRISFTSWLIKVISLTLKDHEAAAGYRKGKRKILVFEDINVSLVVEKTVNGRKIPIPLVIEKAQERSLDFITRQISDARDQQFTDRDVVLHARSNPWEQLYFRLPGFVRRFFWSFLLHHPRLAYRQMGNVAFTSVAMTGNTSGWFIPISVHPVCFGLSNIARKPIVVNDTIEIREVLQMTVLIDHDVIDGAPMARFISDLKSNVEKGLGLP